MPLSRAIFGFHCLPTTGHRLLLMSVVVCECEQLPAVAQGSWTNTVILDIIDIGGIGHGLAGLLQFNCHWLNDRGRGELTPLTREHVASREGFYSQGNHDNSWALPANLRKHCPHTFTYKHINPAPKVNKAHWYGRNEGTSLKAKFATNLWQKAPESSHKCNMSTSDTTLVCTLV